jgi:predicted RNase H-like HicB family nuclease
MDLRAILARAQDLAYSILWNLDDRRQRPSYTLLMSAEYTAVLKQDSDWWIGWIEEVPGVNCQERTREDLVTSLREVLTEAIEFNRQDALTAAGEQFEEERIAL